MLTVINAIYLTILGLVLYVSSFLFKKKKIPKGLKLLPSLPGWPVVGNLFSFHEPLWSFLFKASKELGPIFKFTMGCQEIIVLSSNRILSKTLKDMGTNFSGRWQNIVIKRNIHDAGIIFKDKTGWSIQRSFVLKVLRDFGLGKQRSHEIVNQECSILLKEIEDGCGKVASGRYLFPKSMVNVISKLVMNMRFEREQTNFKLFTTIIADSAQNRNFLLTLIQMYPFLEKLPILLNILIWCTRRRRRSDFIINFIKEIIEEHEKRFNIANEGEDLIDVFLQEQYKLNQDKVEKHTFTDWQLIREVLELFIAGYETTSTTLTWATVLLAKYPDIQTKMHDEIIDLVGSNRMPNLADKKSLAYTQAVMDEIFRFSSVVPLAIPHRVFESTDVDGFYIPKNSVVFPNLFACHRDKDVWERPFEFYPDHFLSKLENGDIKYTPREELVPFGIGKRQCLGEALARMEFFVFLTSIVQRFKIRFEKEMSDDTFSKIIRGTDGGIRAPLDSNVVFEMRL